MSKSGLLQQKEQFREGIRDRERGCQSERKREGELERERES